MDVTPCIFLWDTPFGTITIGQAPLDQPQPGEPGGGRPPIGNEPVVVEALELLPDEAGVKPVAVFPPYLKPKRFEEVALTFEENDSVRRNGWVDWLDY